MAIKKRLTPEQRLIERFGDDWRRVFRHPLLAALCNPSFASSFDIRPENLHTRIGALADPRWISSVSMDDKIFIYLTCLVMKRVFDGEHFLQEEKYQQLAKHLAGLTIMDKLNMGQDVGFISRQAMVWELSRFMEAHPKGSTIIIPPLYQPAPEPIRKRKKLSKHR